MGLAASQMRMLTLTKRTNDVENLLMHNSNERLALSRESSAISAQYSSALNSTKIVYGTADSNTALAYSMFNNANSSYALTDSSGAVLVSSSDVTSWGLDGTGQSNTLPTVKTFLSTTTGATPTEISAYVANPTGSSTSATTGTFTTSYKDSEVFDALTDGSDSITGGYTDVITGSPAYYSVSGKSSMFAFAKGDSITSAIQNQLKGLVSNICSTAGTAVIDVLTAKANYDEDVLKSAVATATDNTVDFYMEKLNHPDELARNNIGNANVDRENANLEAAGGTNDIISNDDGDTTEYSVDTSQVVKTFLTYFDQACAAYAPDKEAATAYVNKNSSTLDTTNIATWGGVCTVNDPKMTNGMMGITTRNGGGTGATASVTGDDDDTTSTDSKLAYFYNLWQEMFENGYKVNDNITDSDYLEDQIGYGNIVIRDVSTWTKETVDGAASDFITIDDDDAADQAKADYEAEKDKIDYKETILDTEQNNLDTERAALTTEKESVQKLLDSNVKKFSLFQNA